MDELDYHMIQNVKCHYFCIQEDAVSIPRVPMWSKSTVSLNVE